MPKDDDAETWDEQRERLTAMAAGGETWDLSDNDRAAIAAALARADRFGIIALERDADRDDAAASTALVWRARYIALCRAIEATIIPGTDDETHAGALRQAAHLVSLAAERHRLANDRVEDREMIAQLQSALAASGAS